ncbi:Choline/Carnitine o-acyltransferase-domain-containing protein [Rhodotorula diobovata]|uniref:Choline/Carnitine o-acyltransferase-domain-containing protein n=1 Tax=Rhodotorula diobovata TaxID=5288 RepID=A0A5C5FXE4_9BASI|nr:Choline/Carnitine o-acyltransferase-domain-containing protein [Rhodotorula diobovata]
MPSRPVTVASTPIHSFPAGKTFQGQGLLPKLPVPPLEDTLERYLKALEALQTPAEHERTKKVVKDFQKHEGPELHQRLKDYAAGRASYIEEWWTESYLSHSESVVLSLNPFFILEDDPTPARGNQLMRATSLILASLSFIHDLRTGQLEPDQFRGTPLDMSQYQKLFGTARIPTRTGCRMQIDTESRHIVVLCRGQFYWFDVLDSKHRPALTERALLSNLTAITADAARTPPNQVAQSALGVLSTERRATWAACRAGLMKNEGNAMCLDVIDKALFVVALDDTSPESATEMCNNMLCGTYKLEKGVQVGTCTNRWYDKLQIIVAANGAAGVNFEHSGVDGHTVLRYVADVYTELILRFARSINPAATGLFKAKLSPWAKGGPGKKAAPKEDAKPEEPEEIDVAPKKLEWIMTPELKMAVRFAETRLSDLICQNEAVALEFDVYGKNAITQHGFSPDAFVQMAYQAAYFSLYGRIECVYEPAMTKSFLHGRTEAVRSVTPESVAFVKTFCSEASPREKIDALRKACKVHTELTKACSKGLGQDRILYAMYCLAQQARERRKRAIANGEASGGGGGDSSSSDPDTDSEDSEVSAAIAARIPDLFKDPGYAQLGHSTLSTSNCGNVSLRLFGFGPVVGDGLGIGYIIKDDSISVVASSKHRQTQRYLDALQAYFVEVHRLLKQLHQEANRKPNSRFVDHFAGEIDAKTGQPITHLHADGRRAEDELSYSDGYGFYGALTQEVEKALSDRHGAAAKEAALGVLAKKRGIVPGTRIKTVEL